MSESDRSYRPRRNPALWGARIAGFVVLGVMGAALFALVFGWFVMLLWNWLMPAIFHAAEITYWQAFGIIILAKLIFGSIGSRARHWGPRPGGWDRHAPWKEARREGMNSWRQYREFWDAEGKQAFDDFIARKRNAEQAPPRDGTV